MKSKVAHEDGRKGRRNVKSGCRTCKIRKVKCDEGYPTCHRCVSTGRICDGYGVWGGGNSYRDRQSHTSSMDKTRNHCTVLTLSAHISSLVVGMEEKEYFDWFKCRTVVKLPGSFLSKFWSTLLLQSSLSEPAVLHAILALSSVHRGGIVDGDGEERSMNVPNKREQFTLQHYIKAIGYLKTHFSTKDKASLRVALITCIAFVSLELLRGHFKTAHIHLQNGLSLLSETHSLCEKDGLLFLRPCNESVDDWIMETFSRLHVQMELFKHFYQHPGLLLQPAQSGPPSLIFHSFKEAWQDMERLLNEIFYLTKQAREHEANCTSLRPGLLEAQQRVRAELSWWLDTYEVSRETLGINTPVEPPQVERAYLLLTVYHSMITIMADTCLHQNETVFDSHTNQFLLLVKQLTGLATITSNMSTSQIPARRLTDFSGSIVDLGWIQPLYYVAVKCRVHRIRLHAVKLLETSFHREGIWDSRIAARVSRKVMEIEERDYYKDNTDHFTISSYPELSDLTLPPLPESYRIRDIELDFCGEPLEKVLLLCRQTHDGIDDKVEIAEYNVLSQSWMDLSHVKIAGET